PVRHLLRQLCQTLHTSQTLHKRKEPRPRQEPLNSPIIYQCTNPSNSKRDHPPNGKSCLPFRSFPSFASSARTHSSTDLRACGARIFAALLWPGCSARPG
ncbi:hypothetical protein M422DRAFT_39474, partial [Sphaerobolus stellatus SS14]